MKRLVSSLLLVTATAVVAVADAGGGIGASGALPVGPVSTPFATIWGEVHGNALISLSEWVGFYVDGAALGSYDSTTEAPLGDFSLLAEGSFRRFPFLSRLQARGLATVTSKAADAEAGANLYLSYGTYDYLAYAEGDVDYASVDGAWHTSVGAGASLSVSDTLILGLHPEFSHTWHRTGETTRSLSAMADASYYPAAPVTGTAQVRVERQQSGLRTQPTATSPLLSLDTFTEVSGEITADVSLSPSLALGVRLPVALRWLDEGTVNEQGTAPAPARDISMTPELSATIYATGRLSFHLGTQLDTYVAESVYQDSTAVIVTAECRLRVR